MDREKYLKGLDFCMAHTACGGCPIKDECKGAYDMLEMTFEYIRELRRGNCDENNRTNSF